MSRLCPKPGVQKLSINQFLKVNRPLKSVTHQNCEDNREFIYINEFLKDVGGHSSLVFRDWTSQPIQSHLSILLVAPLVRLSVKKPHLWEATSM